MWKNVFIESCILSALIFGGFYLSANLMKQNIADQGQVNSHPLTVAAHVCGTPQEGSLVVPESIHVLGGPDKFLSTDKASNPSLNTANP
ncbi:MAG: hypothetical protein COV67_02210 [Nitrospinae bacterium CG11_big_fil_rev_8_21_14_0_20_56_8]|nr:MAG: hypothetical protein COV67_02210 [Nitrospinae bacterium CG11_big_fil_rev_8_21_14_0_20_56_8]